MKPVPELPEVETIKRQLHERLAGKTVREVHIFKTGREFPQKKRFVDRILGKKIKAVDRRAKVLIFRFTDGTAIIGHLKMTGKFLFVPKDARPEKHDRILFVLTGGEGVMWSDIRQFGYLKILSADELAETLSSYGPEPLQTSFPELADRLLSPKTRKIKAALLNQEVIAGVGNIYADEACHRAGIRPTRRLGTLTAEDRLRVVKEVVKVLTESLAQKGTSANDYVDTNGTRGGFLSLLKVYGRVGEPCLTCKRPITKIVLGGRGTHYCGACQK